MRESKPPKRMHYLKSLAEVPRFRSYADEARFWATHSLAGLWDQLEPVEVEVSPSARRLGLQRRRKKPITLRIEERQIARAKALAHAKSLSYQALIRSWINAGIAREERVLKGP